MKIATIIARVLLGLIFVFFGSNAFLHFLPMPPLPQGVAGLYLKAFFESGYVYVIGGMQVIGGLLLLIGRFVPLGLTILAAIIFNIWAFHVLMAPEGFPPALVVSLLVVVLSRKLRRNCAAVTRANSEDRTRRSRSRPDGSTKNSRRRRLASAPRMGRQRDL